MGRLTGANGHNAMMRLGKTEFNWKHMRPEPMTTNPFNTSKDKYIYTEKGGWLDMSHFMFYAGRAYDYKMRKAEAADKLKTSYGPRNGFGPYETDNATANNTGGAKYMNRGNGLGGTLSTEMRGNNPLVWGSPDIAWKSSLNLIYNKDQSTLSVAGFF